MFLDFADSAEDISFELEGDESVPILRANLGNLDGEQVPADLNLAERIGNDAGVLIFRKSFCLEQASHPYWHTMQWLSRGLTGY